MENDGEFNHKIFSVQFAFFLINSDANRRLPTDPSMFKQTSFVLISFSIHYLDYDPRTLYVPDDFLNSITPVSCIHNSFISINVYFKRLCVNGGY
jgi:hypothetical protein